MNPPKTMYISLWESNGMEASFGGYHRQAVQFDIDGLKGTAKTNTPLSWSVSSDNYNPITELRIHDTMWGEALFSCKLDTPARYLGRGDTLNIGAGGVSVGIDAGANVIFNPRVAPPFSLEDYLKDNPDATPSEVWAAAYTSGFETAHTLLTGDPQ